jgi:hypothetical protein
MAVSKITQPNDEVGMKGQIGWPQRWCGKSHAACISHAMPMNRYEFSPRNKTGVTITGYSSSQSPNPPLR